MLTTNDIITRLNEHMGEGMYNELITSIDNAFKKLQLNDTNSSSTLGDLYNTYVYPKIRQYGLKTQVKVRKIVYQLDGMNVFKFNSELGKELQEELRKDNQKFDDMEYEDKYQMVIRLGTDKNLLVEMDHYGLWVKGRIYHWGPGKWRMYGENETDKEITNEWTVSEKYNKIYFTLYKHEELEKYCDEWKQKNFENVDDSRNFIEALINYMGLEDFAS